MNHSTFRIRSFHLTVLACMLCLSPSVLAQEPIIPPVTRTVVADLLEVEGEYYIVRGERGEIRIEVNSDTTIAEEFVFGDRIKAVLLPNDVALSIIRAQKGEPTGVTTNTPPPTASPAEPVSPPPAKSTDAKYSPPPPAPKRPAIRIIVADLLMVDGSFLIVRGERGEIQIEVTPKTQMEETFKFGDRIHARVTKSDKALSVVRASPDEAVGVFLEEEPIVPEVSKSSPPTPGRTQTPVGDGEPQSEPEGVVPQPKIRTIVAKVLMVDGDFIIVRGERGEIQIEVTPKTKISEAFDYGDTIKATVLPNDKALTVERALPTDSLGIQ